MVLGIFNLSNVLCLMITFKATMMPKQNQHSVRAEH